MLLASRARSCFANTPLRHGQQGRRAAVRVFASDSPTAKVKFSVPLHVEFGETVCLVGNLPELGTWAPQSGRPMTWSEGDVWSLDTSLPTGVDVEYKYVRSYIPASPASSETPAGTTESWFEWQEGDNLTLKVPSGASAVTIVDSWGSGRASVDMGDAAAAAPEPVKEQTREEKAPAPITAEATPAVTPEPTPVTPVVADEAKEEPPRQVVVAVVEEEEEVEEPVKEVSPASNILPAGQLKKPTPGKPVLAAVEDEMVEV